MSTINGKDVNALFAGLSRNYARTNASVAQVLATSISSNHANGQATTGSSLLSAMSSNKAATSYGSRMSAPPAPNWDQYLTKRKPEMTEDEYVEAIKEQARKDREAGVFQKGDAFNSLKMSYVSVVSPDRASIVSKAQSAAQSGLSQGLLAQMGQYKDEKGQTVAMYGQKFGWMMMNTDAENTRSAEFMEIYNAEYYAKETPEEGEEAVDGEEGVDDADGEETPPPEGGSIDVEA